VHEHVQQQMQKNKYYKLYQMHTQNQKHLQKRDRGFKGRYREGKYGTTNNLVSGGNIKLYLTKQE
jgi:hypothetical protein